MPQSISAFLENYKETFIPKRNLSNQITGMHISQQITGDITRGTVALSMVALEGLRSTWIKAIAPPLPSTTKERMAAQTIRNHFISGRIDPVFKNASADVNKLSRQLALRSLNPLKWPYLLSSTIKFGLIFLIDIALGEKPQNGLVNAFGPKVGGFLSTGLKYIHHLLKALIIVPLLIVDPFLYAFAKTGDNIEYMIEGLQPKTQETSSPSYEKTIELLEPPATQVRKTPSNSPEAPSQQKPNLSEVKQEVTNIAHNTDTSPNLNEKSQNLNVDTMANANNKNANKSDPLTSTTNDMGKNNAESESEHLQHTTTPRQ